MERRRLECEELIRTRFLHLKDKKILVYGTGKNAELLINALRGFHMEGVLDRLHFEGRKYGIPVLIWEDVTEQLADVLIIAAGVNSTREIFLRIRHECISRNLLIYDFGGKRLSGKGCYEDYTYDEMRVLDCDIRQLKEKIQEYDAVSFDLFDTLVMRKVLEPTDIFDLVEKKANEMGIAISNFKKKRRTAEIRANGENIYHIYEELKTILDMPDELIQTLMRLEWECELENIITRKDMVEAFQYAQDIGRRVAVISDMYLPAELLSELLKKNGIAGYDHLLVSCDYHKSKAAGLFDEYKNIAGGCRCLHIGDNYTADIICAQQTGIDTFYVKSSLDMLKMSKMNALLLSADSIKKRTYIAEMAAELFGSPFALCKAQGFAVITSERQFIELFIAPVVYMYLRRLIQEVQKEQYDGVIFPSRDGYLFERLYSGYRRQHPEMPEGTYITISRKLANAISQYDEDNVRWTKQNYAPKADEEVFWKETMGFAGAETDSIIAESEAGRKSYVEYLGRLGIDPTKKYLFCELISSGTTQGALQSLFEQKLRGFYMTGELCREELYRLVSSLYPLNIKNNIVARRDLFEAILTSPMPSVRFIQADGEFCYEREERTEAEIACILHMHQYIEDFILAFDSAYEKDMDLELLDQVLGSLSGAGFDGEMKAFAGRKTTETMTSVGLSIMRLA